MQEFYKNKININFPQITCIFIIFSYFFISILFFIFNTTKIVYFMLVICFHLFIYFFIHMGIRQKKHSSYKTAIILSLSYSIIISIFKFICYIFSLSLVSFLDKDYSKNTYNDYTNLYIFLFIFTIFLDWLLSIVLLCYNKKVKILCSSNINNESLNNPLINANLVNIQNFNNNNNNNYVQTIMPNNQNLNIVYVQPTFSNKINNNIQSNVQNIGDSNDQLYNSDLKDKSIIQNLDAPNVQSYSDLNRQSIIQNLDAPNVVSNVQNLNASNVQSNE